MKPKDIQAKKTENKSVMSPRPMKPGEMLFELKKMKLTNKDIAIRTGVSEGTVSNTISGKTNSPTVLGYLEDLGINHNRPYDRDRMLASYNPEEAA